MESFHTRIREKIREIFLLINYLLWYVFSPSKFKKINKKEIKNVLIISFGAIGELLVLTTLLPALKRGLNCKISFMISNKDKNIFKNNPYVSEVIIHKGFKENIKELKKRKFDLGIIAFPGSFKYSLMCLLAGIKYQIGWANDFTHGPPLFFNKSMLQGKRKHVVQDNLDMIRLIGLDNKNPKMEFHFSEKDKKNAKQKLKKLKIKDYVIIHPGAGKVNKLKYPAKLWPIERYAKIIDYLSKKYSYKILMTGSENEKELNERIIKLTKEKNKTINVAGIFGLEELAYIISKTKLIIAPNTSVVHFASVFHSPLIELDSVGRPYQWSPWRNDKNYKVLFHNEVCTGCNGTECRKKTTECMKAISVEEAEKAVKEFL